MNVVSGLLGIDACVGSGLREIGVRDIAFVVTLFSLATTTTDAHAAASSSSPNMIENLSLSIIAEM
jgi:hypothetical protein